MVRSAIPVDTSAPSFAMLTESWRTMDLGERADLMQQLCVDVERLARADIHARHPEFTETEICHELARRRYGSSLADTAYADLLRHG